MINYNIRVENPEKYHNALKIIRYECPNCGRKATIPKGVSKQLCSYCRHYVYSSDLARFKGELGKIMKKRFV